MNNDINDTEKDINPIPINEDTKPKKKAVKKKVAKKASKKTVKKAVKKTAKTTKKVAKKTTKKTTVKRKKTIKNDTENPIHSIAEKTFKIFDSIIDEIKEIPKKTTEFSKQNQFIDSVTNLLTKTKEEFILKKNEFSELHNLNMSVSSNKRTLVELFLKLGRKTYELIDKNEIESSELKHFFEQINNIEKDIKLKEAQIKTIISKK